MITKRHWFIYEKQDVYVITEYDGVKYKAYFELNPLVYKLDTARHMAIDKLWRFRRKADGKTTQSKYIAPKGEQLKMLPIKQRPKKKIYSKIVPANPSKPLLKPVIKDKLLDKPPKYKLSRLSAYEPSKPPKPKSSTIKETRGAIPKIKKGPTLTEQAIEYGKSGPLIVANGLPYINKRLKGNSK